MTAERVALLYMAMDDDDTLRGRLSTGDFSAEDAAELTDVSVALRAENPPLTRSARWTPE